MRCYKCTSNDGGEQCNSEQRIAACTNREHVCYSLSYSLTLHVSKNATKTRFITTKGCFDRNTSCQKACRQFSVSLSYKNCKVSKMFLFRDQKVEKSKLKTSLGWGGVGRWLSFWTSIFIFLLETVLTTQIRYFCKKMIINKPLRFILYSFLRMYTRMSMIAGRGKEYLKPDV